MPGRQITDHQMELYMTSRKTNRRALAQLRIWGFYVGQPRVITL